MRKILLALLFTSMTLQVFSASEEECREFMIKKFIAEPAKQSWAVWLKNKKLDTIFATVGLTAACCCVPGLVTACQAMDENKEKFEEYNRRFTEIAGDTNLPIRRLHGIELVCKKSERVGEDDQWEAVPKLVFRDDVLAVYANDFAQRNGGFLRALLQHEAGLVNEFLATSEEERKAHTKAGLSFLAFLGLAGGGVITKVLTNRFYKKIYKDILFDYVYDWDNNKDFTLKEFWPRLEEGREWCEDGAFDQYFEEIGFDLVKDIVRKVPIGFDLIKNVVQKIS